MLIIKIVIGLFGLGIVVIIHELGHFLAARLVKIDVEAFSIGWGNPIIKKKVGAVEYRIGMFPVGGYCKMKGETDYKEAWDNMNRGIMPEKGSYLAASPASRILVCFAGPFFNLIFACLLLSMIWGSGVEINTLGNKIILSSEVIPGEAANPADIAGFKTGDRIVEIDGKEVAYFHEIREKFALNPNKQIPVVVERDGRLQALDVTPFLDKSTGAGRIGITFWADPIVDTVKEGSPAERAGLARGDKIISVNGEPLKNSMDFVKIRQDESEKLVVEYDRGGITKETEFSSEDLKGELGFSWEIINYRTPKLSVPAAIAKGIKESYRTLVISVTSLRLLFMGIDLTQAVSGPVRITYMMGDMATQGFEQGVGTGLRSFAEFVAIISIALCIMNLLPLPIVDGGMIILFLVEWIRKKPAHPKAISIFQTCGMVIIGCLMFFALFGDIKYFVQK
jgi:regulator of sigma E protease